ncbi:DNA-packaging protein [Pseudomonas sp. L5B5]|uniref:DNA-packaging protein n=1 Tax=Pseudomonas sp. L5B5 TaxID=2883205 RepID=UPI001CFAC722|nr:DNA-packaging protein [Pseudomonas sp. L5B5]UCZ84442.1 DNA-packaging protein [Pseudomonas sp. L5B5]
MNAIKPLLIWLAVIAVAVGGLTLTYRDGYDQGFALAKAEGEAVLGKQAKEREAQMRRLAESAAVELKKAADDLIAERARSNQLAAELGAKREELRAVTDKLNGEIQRVTTKYRRAIDAQPEPLPPAVFTAGFVRVWNSALFGTASPVAVPSSSSASSRTDATGTGAGTADDLIAGVTRADLLANHVRNSEGYALCRAQLKKLIEWNAKNGSN